jgi:hypothetical protein
LFRRWSVISSHSGPDLIAWDSTEKARSDKFSSTGDHHAILAHPSADSAAKAAYLSPTVIEQLTGGNWSHLLFISHFLQSQDPQDKVDACSVL